MTIFQRFAAALEHSPAYRSLLYLWGHLPIPKPVRWAIMWMGIQKYLVGVSAVVLNERNEVLLFKHTYRTDFDWGLPGGWLKFGEHPARAVEREICEESGMRVAISHPIYVNQRPDYPHLEVIHIGRWVSGDFRPSPEVSEGRFFTREELPPIYPEVLAVLEAVWENK